MNLWWRLLRLLVLSRWRPRIQAPFGTSYLTLRVWPGDLDTSLHMNNGRYWTLMDLGRTDLMLRSGLWRAVVRNRWVPVINTGAIRFRRELRLLQRIRLETRIISWDHTHFVIRQDLVTADGQKVAATALVRAGLYDRRQRSFVPTAQVLQVAGVTAPASTPGPEAMLMAEIGHITRVGPLTLRNAEQKTAGCV